VNVNNERTNDPEPMVGAIISTDREFRTRLTEILASEGGIEVDFAVDEPFTAITDFHLRELRRVDPDVAFVDLESDPQVGLKFSEFLLDSSIAGAVVGAGTTESPDLLVQAMQAGILEFLPKPLDPDKVGGVVERLRRKTGKAQAREAPSQLGRLLSVFSPKGGTGATTFAVNLAVTIHQLSRKRTLIVDLDLELGETALLLGKEPQFSSVDLVRNYHRVDEKLLASYIERDESGVELLSAPYQPADVESVDGERIGKILGFLKGHYDYIIADAPKTLSPLTLNAFEASDHLLLVTTPDLQSLRNVNRSLPLLKGLGDRRPDDWLRLVVNRFSSSDPITVEEVQRTLRMKVYRTISNDYRTVHGSINEGRPAVLAGKSRYADDVRELAADITGIRSIPKRSRGMLGGLVAALRNGNGRAPEPPPRRRHRTEIGGGTQ
jgi:pilus assembly protein CpaE